MQYLLSVIHEFEYPQLPDEEMQQMFKSVDAYNQELMKNGQFVFAGGLAAPDTATTIRLKDGVATTVDGPYAETKEIIGGFWVIDAPDLDKALELGREGSIACGADVEVRPFQGIVEQ